MSVSPDFLPDPLPTEPLDLAADWLAEAWQRRDQPNPNSMVLATADSNGRIGARVVLCKEIVAVPGYVVFYTNYRSRKGLDLGQNPRAAIVLHWDHLHRQVRVEGEVVLAPAAESDEYFASRPWQRRIGAWTSEQSQPIGSRAEFLAALGATAKRFGTPMPGPESDRSEPRVTIPRPPFWGGYRVWVDAVELWVEGESRFHDRVRWTRSLALGANGDRAPGPWTATRLQP